MAVSWCAPALVELRYPFSRTGQVGHDEADPRTKLAWMPLDLGHHAPLITADLGLRARLGGLWIMRGFRV